MKNVLALFALLAALGFAACGSEESTEGGDDGESQLVSPPEVTASLDEQMQALNEAIATDDCEAFSELTFTFLRPLGDDGQFQEPGSPGTAEECKNTEQVRGMLDGVELTESAEYGTVGVTEGALPKPVGGYDTMVVNWLLDSDGQYRHTFLGPSDPAIGTEPLEGTDFDAVIDGMLEAVRSGDCSGAEGLFHEAGLFAEAGSTPEEQCEALAGGQIFAPALKETAEPGVEQLGATLDQVWYGIGTEEAYFTVTLSTPIAKQRGSLSDEEQGTFTVTDVIPNTVVELDPPEDEKKKG